MVTAQFMDAQSAARFPYPFLNYEQTGIPVLIVAVSVITFFYLVIGYLFFFIDRKMGYLENDINKDVIV